MASFPTPPLQLRHRRAATWLAAGAIAVFFVGDAGAGLNWITVAARLTWIATVLAIGLTGREATGFGTARALVLGASSAVCETVIIAASGGAASINFGYLYALPFAALVLFPGETLAAVVMTVGCTASGTAMLVRAHASPGTAAAFVAACAATSALALFGTRSYRLLREAEVAAAQARAHAVAELAESERRRARAERLALVGQLAAGVAHEINNPLSYVKSNVTWTRQALARAGDDAFDLVQALAESETGLARIQSIVADLRAFARDDDAPETCDAVQAAREALRLAAMRVARAAITTAALPDDQRRVRMSRTRLVQALVNLIVNAADALEGAGRRDGHIVVRLEDTADHVVLSVADDGPGLSPEAEAHLFEPFFTTKGALGTGLGLALTREYVEHYGGSVEAGARPGGGALFTLRLRRSEPGEEPTVTPAPVSRTGTP